MSSDKKVPNLRDYQLGKIFQETTEIRQESDDSFCALFDAMLVLAVKERKDLERRLRFDIRQMNLLLKNRSELKELLGSYEEVDDEIFGSFFEIHMESVEPEISQCASSMAKNKAALRLALDREKKISDDKENFKAESRADEQMFWSMVGYEPDKD